MLKIKKSNRKFTNSIWRRLKKVCTTIFKEDTDTATQQKIPRKYFSGGYDGQETTEKLDHSSLASHSIQDQEAVERPHGGTFLVKEVNVDVGPQAKMEEVEKFLKEEDKVQKPLNGAPREIQNILDEAGIDINNIVVQLGEQNVQEVLDRILDQVSKDKNDSRRQELENWLLGSNVMILLDDEDIRFLGGINAPIHAGQKLDILAQVGGEAGRRPEVLARRDKLLNILESQAEAITAGELAGLLRKEAGYEEVKEETVRNDLAQDNRLNNHPKLIINDRESVKARRDKLLNILESQAEAITAGELAELLRKEAGYEGVKEGTVRNDLTQDNRLNNYPKLKKERETRRREVQNVDNAILTTAEPIASQDHLGGINLNPALLDLQIKRDGKGIPLPINQQPIWNMKIEGFIPVIINVTPVSLPLLLGENQHEVPANPVPTQQSRITPAKDSMDLRYSSSRSWLLDPKKYFQTEIIEKISLN